MIRFQKRPILVVVGQPTYIRKEAKDKHNEVTVALARYAMPVGNIFQGGEHSLSAEIVKAVEKIGKCLQGIELEFNRLPQAPAFTFIVKAKTERRGDDVHNQELADKIVTAKLNAKACVIARKVLEAIAKCYCNELTFNNSMCELLDGYVAREHSYIKKM